MELDRVCGTDRLRYLQTLVTEFQDTENKDHRKQVLANLANFAYDPINYEYLRKLNVLDLFLDVLVEEKDECMIEFALGGICNCCLDRINQEFLIQSGAIAIVLQHLASSQEDTVLSALTILIFMITEPTKDITSESIKIIKQFSVSPNKRLSNLAVIFLEQLYSSK